MDLPEIRGEFYLLVAKFPQLAGNLADLHFQLLLQCGKPEAAWKLGADLVAKAIRHKDASSLNQIAWTIVDPEKDWSSRDLKLALEAAKWASELTKGEDGAILDTLARVHFRLGDVERAIDLQEKAVLKVDPRMRPSLEKALEEYRKAKGGDL